jgi:hypothetical protein
MNNQKFKNLGISTVASIIAGAYYLYNSKEGVETRKNLRGWAVKMQGEIMERIEKLKDVTDEAYNTIVDEVSKKYKEQQETGELDAFVKDIKKKWTKVSKDVKAEVKKRANTITGITVKTKSVKSKVVKKSTKKVASKKVKTK